MIDPDDRLQFGEAMFALAAAFNEPMSKLRAEAYFDALSDLPMEAANVAVRLAMRQSRFFPKPVELRELIEGSPDGHADKAWGELIREVRRVGYMGTPQFSDERTLRAIGEVWGGWRRLCETLPGEGPELIGWMKQFKASLQSLEKRDVTKLLTPQTIHPTVLDFIRQGQAALPEGKPR